MAIGAGMAGLWLFAVAVTPVIVIWPFRAPVAVFCDSAAWPRMLALVVTALVFVPAGLYALVVLRS